MRCLVLAAATICIGCTPPPVRDSLTPVTVQQGVTSSQSTSKTQPAAIDQRLVGTYYRGDGTGFNLTLSLSETGTFDCVWTGCLGAYGSSAGRWTTEGDQVVTKTLTADGMMEGKPLGSLTIIEDDGDQLLVQDSIRDFFDEHGPSRFACFSRAGREWNSKGQNHPMQPSGEVERFEVDDQSSPPADR